MFDVQGLPPANHSNTQVFLPTGNVDTWDQWVKPRGTTMVNIWMMSGGGGGGAGASGASPTNRCGGGSGGSGSLVQLTIPAALVPDILYVQAGQGGAGGTVGATAGNAGATGGRCFVSLGSPLLGTPANYSGVNTLVAATSTVFAGGGGGGATGATAGGAAGVTSTAATTATAIGHAWGQFVSVVGRAGTAGGNAGLGGGGNINTNAVSVAPNSSGAGAPGCTGASISGSRVIRSAIVGYIDEVGSQTLNSNGNATGRPDGQAGVSVSYPLSSTGGGGGAAIFNGQAGVGGQGGFPGSGGGGGGAGVTGGKGGDGGAGVVIITAW